MKKACEYHRHAAECRVMASRAHDPEHKAMLLQMAETWDSLAVAREMRLARQRRIGDD